MVSVATAAVVLLAALVSLLFFDNTKPNVVSDEVKKEPMPMSLDGVDINEVILSLQVSSSMQQAALVNLLEEDRIRIEQGLPGLSEEPTEEARELVKSLVSTAAAQASLIVALSGVLVSQAALINTHTRRTMSSTTAIVGEQLLAVQSSALSSHTVGSPVSETAAATSQLLSSAVAMETPTSASLPSEAVAAAASFGSVPAVQALEHGGAASLREALRKTASQLYVARMPMPRAALDEQLLHPVAAAPQAVPQTPAPPLDDSGRLRSAASREQSTAIAVQKSALVSQRASTPRPNQHF